VLVVTFAVLLDGELLVSRGRRLFAPRHRERADWAGRIVYRTLGRYFAGSLLLAMSNGLYILAVGLALGVPLAPLAAIWAMLMNLVPQIGGFLGGLVFVTLAVTDSVGTGAVALILFLVYNSTDNYLLQPLVVGSAVRMSPPGAMMSAFIGAAIAGIPGALVATPLVGAAKLMYTDVRYGTRAEEHAGAVPSVREACRARDRHDLRPDARRRSRNVDGVSHPGIERRVLQRPGDDPLRHRP
jgi:predicted PurR-regulated permease PerM